MGTQKILIGKSEFNVATQLRITIEDAGTRAFIGVHRPEGRNYSRFRGSRDHDIHPFYGDATKRNNDSHEPEDHVTGDAFLRRTHSTRFSMTINDKELC